MEYEIQVNGPIDTETLTQVLCRADPAALLDRHDALVRVATYLPSDRLRQAFAEAGYRVSDSEIRQLPSVCCGGCGG